MNTSDRPNPRRKFLLTALATPVAAVVVSRTVLAEQGAALPHLDPADPQAKGLGYVDNAKNINPKAEATYKPGARCGTCLQFRGQATDAWGPCNIFPGKAVSSSGWCRVWAAKS